VVGEIRSGGEITLLLYAADNQIGYLFNSYNYGRGNQPLLNVTVSPAPPKLISGYFTNGWFQLTGNGTPNLSYGVQASSNLAGTHWQGLGNAIADGAGVIRFSDTNVPGQNERFYRLTQ
jgi:hypothetical protein